MTLMTAIILLVAFFCIFFCFSFGHARTPFILVLGWWFFWLWISSLSLTGIYVPSASTYLLYLLLLFSVFSGGFIYVSRQKFIRGPDRKNTFSMEVESNFYIRKKIDNLTAFTILIIVPIVGYFLMRAIQIFLTYDSLLLYRAATFIIEEGDESIVYGSGRIVLLYDLIVRTIVWLVFFTGAAYWLKTGSKKLFVLGSILIIVQSITALGRFGFYYVIAMTAFVSIMRFALYDKLNKISNTLSKIFILVLSIVIVIGIGSVRAGGEFKVKGFIGSVIVPYHTAGFTLFDIELNNPDSYLNKKNTYGQASLGSLLHIPVLLLKRIDRDVEYIPAEIGGDMHDKRIIGERFDGYPITSNAFITAIYPLYIDGGVFLIIVAGLVYGFLLAKTSFFLFSRRNALWYGFLLCALIHCGIFSIFQAVTSSLFWLYVLLGYFYLHCRFNIKNILSFRISNVRNSY